MTSRQRGRLLTEVERDSIQELNEEINKMKRLPQNPANPCREVGRSVRIYDYQMAADSKNKHIPFQQLE